MAQSVYPDISHYYSPYCLSTSSFQYTEPSAGGPQVESGEAVGKPLTAAGPSDSPVVLAEPPEGSRLSDWLEGQVAQG